MRSERCAFVTGPYGDINPLYLRTYFCVCSGALEKCWSWVDLVVNCCCSVPILHFNKFPPTHPLAVAGKWTAVPLLRCGVSLLLRLSSTVPAKKKKCAGLGSVVFALDCECRKLALVNFSGAGGRACISFTGRYGFVGLSLVTGRSGW